MSIVNRLILSAAALVCATAITSCAQSNQTADQGSPADANQGQWLQYTADADKAAKQGDKTAAEQLYKQAIAEAEKLGESNPVLPKAVSNMADFYYAQGDGDRADELYQRAIAVREKALGAENVDIAEDLVGLARVRISQRKMDEARSLYARAIKLYKKANLPVPPDVQNEADGLTQTTR